MSRRRRRIGRSRNCRSGAIRRKLGGSSWCIGRGWRRGRCLKKSRILGKPPSRFIRSFSIKNTSAIIYTRGFSSTSRRRPSASSTISSRPTWSKPILCPPCGTSSAATNHNWCISSVTTAKKSSINIIDENSINLFRIFPRIIFSGLLSTSRICCRCRSLTVS